MISAQVLADTLRLRESFEEATPFRHVAIDSFLDESACEALLRDFPAFEQGSATNERGRLGLKAVVERVETISPFYAAFYDYINSTPFLEAMSALTGIPDLIADKTLYGGGTHDNRHGQGLDTHVDFNVDERRMLHRRINLLIYLNRDWDDAWGGAIELHSNPRQPLVDETKSYSPLFNRALIFETNEYSWHGFRKIDLPPGERHRSRKSFSIYLYTRDRPLDEVVGSHTTFYVPQPLPERFAEGYALTGSDVTELRTIMASRDGLLEMYQRFLVEKEQKLRAFMDAHRDVYSRHFDIASSRVFRLALAAQRLRFRMNRFLGR